MTVFLSQDNAQYISKTFIKFMFDKYTFVYTNAISDTEYYKLLGDTMTAVYAQHKGDKTTGSMNMITITALKKHFCDQYINAPTPTPAPIYESVVTDVPDTGLNTIEEEENMAFSEDSDFLNKIQRLELNRKTITMTGSEKNALSSITSPLTDMNSPIYNTAPPHVPMTINTVFMPSPIKIGKEIKIHSTMRDWTRPTEKDRNYFRWRGPIPKLIDRSNTRIGCLICPTKILEDTNMISLVISGANEDEVSISLIPSHSVGDYTIFRPILESLSYLKLLALPWKIGLESGDAEKIDLGSDGLEYTLLAGREGAAHTTTLVVEDSDDFCKVGDSLRIFYEKSKIIIRSKVVRVTGVEIDVVGLIRETGQILNYSRQISIILEMTITEHKNDS